MSTSSIDVTIVIPNWNGKFWLPGCLLGLKNQIFNRFRIIIVDNGSTDGSLEYIREEYPDIIIIQNSTNKGFAAAVNSGILASETKYIVLLNTDTIPHKNWLKALVETLENAPEQNKSASSKMLMLDHPDKIDDAGDSLSWFGSSIKRGHNLPLDMFQKEEHIFSACAGAAIYRKDLFETIGLFDEKFESYLEDIDIGLRSQMRGYSCLFVPHAEIYHKGHGSNIKKGRYIRLITRNRLMVFFKNIPLKNLVHNSPSFLFGQLWYFWAYRSPKDSIFGYWSFLKILPDVLRERKKIISKITLTTDEINVLLTQDYPR